MKTKLEFLDKYASSYTRHNMGLDLERLIDALSEQMAEAEIMSPSEVGGEIFEDCPVLEIGEGGEQGFYVVTDDSEKAEKAANAYLLDRIGETLADHFGPEYGAEKESIYVYTKPWETGIYEGWHWYKRNSAHEKSEWAFRFDLE